MGLAVRIDATRCTGCEACLPVCPHDTLNVNGEPARARVRGTRCMACGHCAAACPEGAIRVDGLEAPRPRVADVPLDTAWQPPGGGDAAVLLGFMRSRRSCRRFTADPVARRLLADLAYVGTLAPSGCNDQGWTFTILPTRDAVIALAERVATFFRRLNRMASRPWLRRGLALAGRPALARYHATHQAVVADALEQWRRDGRDRLFHGAPAVMLVGARNEAACGFEDALLATQNILLAAHGLGLGTCLVGFVAAAMRRDPAIAAFAGVPSGESVRAVIALGYPAERYQRPAGRRPAVIRYHEPRC